MTAGLIRLFAQKIEGFPHLLSPGTQLQLCAEISNDEGSFETALGGNFDGCDVELSACLPLEIPCWFDQHDDERGTIEIKLVLRIQTSRDAPTSAVPSLTTTIGRGNAVLSSNSDERDGTQTRIITMGRGIKLYCAIERVALAVGKGLTDGVDGDSIRIFSSVLHIVEARDLTIFVKGPVAHKKRYYLQLQFIPDSPDLPGSPSGLSVLYPFISRSATARPSQNPESALGRVCWHQAISLPHVAHNFAALPTLTHTAARSSDETLSRKNGYWWASRLDLRLALLDADTLAPIGAFAHVSVAHLFRQQQQQQQQQQSEEIVANEVGVWLPLVPEEQPINSHLYSKKKEDDGFHYMVAGSSSSSSSNGEGGSDCVGMIRLCFSPGPRVIKNADGNSELSTDKGADSGLAKDSCKSKSHCGVSTDEGADSGLAKDSRKSKSHCGVSTDEGADSRLAKDSPKSKSYSGAKGREREQVEDSDDVDKVKLSHETITANKDERRKDAEFLVPLYPASQSSYINGFLDSAAEMIHVADSTNIMVDIRKPPEMFSQEGCLFSSFAATAPKCIKSSCASSYFCTPSNPLSSLSQGKTTVATAALDAEACTTESSTKVKPASFFLKAQRPENCWLSLAQFTRLCAGILPRILDLDLENWVVVDQHARHTDSAADERQDSKEQEIKCHGGNEKSKTKRCVVRSDRVRVLRRTNCGHVLNGEVDGGVFLCDVMDLREENSRCNDVEATSECNKDKGYQAPVSTVLFYQEEAAVVASVERLLTAAHDLRVSQANHFTENAAVASSVYTFASADPETKHQSRIDGATLYIPWVLFKHWWANDLPVAATAEKQQAVRGRAVASLEQTILQDVGGEDMGSGGGLLSEMRDALAATSSLEKRGAKWRGAVQKAVDVAGKDVISLAWHEIDAGDSDDRNDDTDGNGYVGTDMKTTGKKRYGGRLDICCGATVETLSTFLDDVEKRSRVLKIKLNQVKGTRQEVAYGDKYEGSTLLGASCQENKHQLFTEKMPFEVTPCCDGDESGRSEQAHTVFLAKITQKESTDDLILQYDGDTRNYPNVAGTVEDFGATVAAITPDLDTGTPGAAAAVAHGPNAGTLGAAAAVAHGPNPGTPGHIAAATALGAGFDEMSAAAASMSGGSYDGTPEVVQVTTMSTTNTRAVTVIVENYVLARGAETVYVHDDGNDGVAPHIRGQKGSVGELLRLLSEAKKDEDCILAASQKLTQVVDQVVDALLVTSIEETRASFQSKKKRRRRQGFGDGRLIARDQTDGADNLLVLGSKGVGRNEMAVGSILISSSASPLPSSSSSLPSLVLNLPESYNSDQEKSGILTNGFSSSQGWSDDTRISSVDGSDGVRSGVISQRDVVTVVSVLDNFAKDVVRYQKRILTLGRERQRVLDATSSLLLCQQDYTTSGSSNEGNDGTITSLLRSLTSSYPPPSTLLENNQQQKQRSTLVALDMSQPCKLVKRLDDGANSGEGESGSKFGCNVVSRSVSEESTKKDIVKGGGEGQGKIGEEQGGRSATLQEDVQGMNSVSKKHCDHAEQQQESSDPMHWRGLIDDAQTKLRLAAIESALCHYQEKHGGDISNNSSTRSEEEEQKMQGMRAMCWCLGGGEVSKQEGAVQALAVLLAGVGAVVKEMASPTNQQPPADLWSDCESTDCDDSGNVWKPFFLHSYSFIYGGIIVDSGGGGGCGLSNLALATSKVWAFDKNKKLDSSKECLWVHVRSLLKPLDSFLLRSFVMTARAEARARSQSENTQSSSVVEFREALPLLALLLTFVFGGFTSPIEYDGAGSDLGRGIFGAKERNSSAAIADHVELPSKLLETLTAYRRAIQGPTPEMGVVEQVVGIVTSVDEAADKVSIATCLDVTKPDEKSSDKTFTAEAVGVAVQDHDIVETFDDDMADNKFTSEDVDVSQQLAHVTKLDKSSLDKTFTADVAVQDRDVVATLDDATIEDTSTSELVGVAQQLADVIKQDNNSSENASTAEVAGVAVQDRDVIATLDDATVEDTSTSELVGVAQQLADETKLDDESLDKTST